MSNFALTIWDVSAIAGCGSAMSGQADAAFALHRNCQCRRTMIIYVSKSKILWSHGTRDTLLSEYQADVSLAEITRTSRLRPRLGAPVAAEAEVVPPRRGRQDLWIPRPPLTASSALRLFSFLLPPSSKNIKTFYHSFGQPKLPVFRAFRARSVSCL